MSVKVEKSIDGRIAADELEYCQQYAPKPYTDILRAFLDSRIISDWLD